MPISLRDAPLWLERVLLIVLFFLIAWLVTQVAPRIAGRVVHLHRIDPRTRAMSLERQATVHSLIASAISIAAFIAAAVASLSLFVNANTLLWVIGLFSAGFGLGARDIINDFLTGISQIFEDTFAVGEKVELKGVEGVVEAVNLRTTKLRAPSGELVIVPNGDVRLVRNYSRGRFSPTPVTIAIASSDLGRAIPLLEELGHEAVYLLPDLIEPWKVISPSGAMGQQTELTLLAKAAFGKGAELRPRLLALVHERLAEAGIELAS